MNLPEAEILVFVIISSSLKLSPQDRNMLFKKKKLDGAWQTAKRDKLHISPSDKR